MSIARITAPLLTLRDYRLAMSSLSLFDVIAGEIYQQGFSLQINALPQGLAKRLHTHVLQLPSEAFGEAGIGRQNGQQRNQAVRSDSIRWMSDSVDVEVEWQAWAGQLQSALNRRLFLGLFSFESHFAHYSVGDFYKRHLDAFKGQANRTVSLVVYLNPDWNADNGGELVLYSGQDDKIGVKIVPSFATVVVFLSEEFPHEVLPALCGRYSIAGWFRINTSVAGRVDPPA